MKNFSLIKILSAGLFAGIAIIFAISGYSIYQNYKISQIVSSINDHPIVVINNVRDIRVDVRTLWEITTKAIYQNTYPASTPAKIIETENKIDKEYQVVKAQYLGNPKDVEDIRANYTKLKAHIHQAIEIRNTKGAVVAAKYMEDNNVESIYHQISSEVNDVIKFAENRATLFQKQANDMTQAGMENILLLSLAILLTGVVISIILMRRIKQSFIVLEEGIESINQDIFKPIPVNKGELLEFSFLKNAFNKMINSIVESRRIIDSKNEEILAQNASLMEQARTLEEFNVELDASYEEAKRSNHMLENERNRYSALLKSATDGIHVVDTKGNITEFSDSFARMLGYSHNEMYSLNLADFEAQLPKDRIVETIQGLVGKSAIFETKLRRKDGSIVDVEINVSGINIGGKEYMYASARDLSESKANERQQELLLSSLGDGVYGTDTGGKCTFINNAALKMLGYELEEVLGLHQHELFHSSHKNGDFYPADECPIYKTLHDAQSREEESEAFIRKNGEHFDVHFKVAPIIESGAVVGSVVIFQDITGRKLLEENLKNMNIHLNQLVAEETEKRLEKEKLLIQQSKMASMGEMIGAIAHQWKQPLSALSIGVQDIEMAYQFGELDDNYFTNYKTLTMDTINTMSDTITDFRNFFSPNKKVEEFFIEDALSESLSILNSQLKVHGTNVIFDKDSTHKHSYACYKNELKQVLLNVLANAKDALFEKKPQNPFIKINVTQTNNELLITIEDSAGGIPEDIIGKIFDAHFTTKSDDVGTGIGLYMSKQIIEESLKGTITAINTKNGAMFSIKLPK